VTACETLKDSEESGRCWWSNLLQTSPAFVHTAKSQLCQILKYVTGNIRGVHAIASSFEKEGNRRIVGRGGHETPGQSGNASTSI